MLADFALFRCMSHEMQPATQTFGEELCGWLVCEDGSRCSLAVCREGTDSFLDRTVLSHAAFETHAEELLSLHGKLHRQFVDDILGIAVDNEVDSGFGGDAALVAVEELVLADF